MRSLGADEVIDYTRDDFTRTGERYDLLIDNAANRSLSAMRRALAPDGVAVLVGAAPGDWVGPIARLAAAGLMSRGGRRLIGHLTETRRDDLLWFNEAVASGEVTPAIDRCYPLAQAADAIRYLETLHARAKVIVTP